MGAETAERIVRAALELFWEKGYQSTSVSDILARSGVNAGSLYHFFPGKQDVLLAVLRAYRDGIHAMLLEPAWAKVSDPVEKVFALLGQYRNAIEQTKCTYGCPIGSLALEIHEPDPPVRKLLSENFKAWTDAVAACIRQAARNSRLSLPAGSTPQSLAEFVLTTMEGGVMLSRTFRDIRYFDRAVAQLRNYFDLLKKGAKRVKK